MLVTSQILSGTDLLISRGNDATRYVTEVAVATSVPTASLPTPSLYTASACAHAAPGSPMRTRSSRECPGGPGHSLLPLDSGRSGMWLKDESAVVGGADVRSAKPRGAEPECRAELRPTRHRATSHNGARYAKGGWGSGLNGMLPKAGHTPQCLISSIRLCPEDVDAKWLYQGFEKTVGMRMGL